MHRYFTGLAALGISLLVSMPGSAQPVGAGEPGSVTAIDILLDPDATMIQHAVAANERGRQGRCQCRPWSDARQHRRER